MLPSVGIVIPAYNEEDSIRACVTAAIGQTVPAAEIIVVDNKSTDGTSAILDELVAQHPEVPLRILRQESAQGIIPTRDMGFDAVTSDIIGRIDADTLLEPDWVENVARVFLDASFTRPRDRSSTTTCRFGVIWPGPMTPLARRCFASPRAIRFCSVRIWLCAVMPGGPFAMRSV